LNGKSNNLARGEVGSLSNLHTFSVNYSISITMWNKLWWHDRVFACTANTAHTVWVHVM